jgi:hypothetical protein
VTQLSLLCQRWRRGRANYRPPAEPFDPALYGVEVVNESSAKDFTVAHHYEGSWPSARLSIGLHRAGVGLVGVAAFSTPGGPAVLPAYFGETNGVELGRFVLLDEEPGNIETWLLARAFGLLRSELPEVDGVLAFSDPMPRTNAAGESTMRGHVGTIYQAFNGRFRRQTARSTEHLDNDGRLLAPRTLSKIRKGNLGRGDKRYHDLVARGAPARQRGESPKQWLHRSLRDGPFRRRRHPGKLAYSWQLRRPKHQPNPGSYPCSCDSCRSMVSA